MVPFGSIKLYKLEAVSAVVEQRKNLRSDVSRGRETLAPRTPRTVDTLTIVVVHTKIVVVTH